MIKNLILIFTLAILGTNVFATPVFAVSNYGFQSSDLPVQETVKPEKKRELKPIIPVELQINIPGISMKDTVVLGDGKNGCAETEICVKTIDTYLNGVYKWGAGAAVIFAIVLIMIGGVEYMIGSAVGTIERAKKRIKNASMGLLVLFSITAILSFINPNIVKLGPIALPVVEGLYDKSDETKYGSNEAQVINLLDEDGNSILTSDFENDCLKGNGVVVHPDIIEALRTAACKTKERSGFGITIASGGRTNAEQARIWLAEFKTKDITKYSQGSKKAVCNPWPRSDESSPFTSKDHSRGPWTVDESVAEEFKTREELNLYLIQQATENDKISCPHVPGTAVDAWCNDGIGNYTDTVKCHLILEEEMNAAGFKRLGNEGWHFEYAGGGYTPMSASAKSGVWTPGITNAYKKCSNRPEAYGSTCIFNYSACTSTYANQKEFCCSDKKGICCDGKSGGSPNSDECNPSE